MPADRAILKGEVAELKSYGATINLEDGRTGLVHISEVSEDYVYDVHDYLTVGMTVEVVALNDDSSKLKLSIKETGVALPKLAKTTNRKALQRQKDEKKAMKEEIRKRMQEERKQRLMSGPIEDDDSFANKDLSFEERLKKYIKESDDRLTDIKHQTDSKIGGGNNKRG